MRWILSLFAHELQYLHEKNETHEMSAHMLVTHSPPGNLQPVQPYLPIIAPMASIRIQCFLLSFAATKESIQWFPQNVHTKGEKNEIIFIVNAVVAVSRSSLFCFAWLTRRTQRNVVIDFRFGSLFICIISTNKLL